MVTRKRPYPDTHPGAELKAMTTTRIGADILYRIAENQLRPGKVVQVWDDRVVDLVVWTNGQADAHHLEDAQAEAKAYLEEHGYTVIRFTNEQVACELDAVVAVIGRWCEEFA